MAIIQVEGLGQVEIEGDAPNERERDAIIRALQAQRGAVSSPAAPAANLPSQPLDDTASQPGFFGGSTLDLGRRGQNIIDSIAATESFTGMEGQGVPETAAQVASQGIGLLGDVTINALSSLYNALPDTRFGLDDLGGLAIDAFMALPGSEFLAQQFPILATDARVRFNRQPARTQRNIEALATLAPMAVPAIAAPVRRTGQQLRNVGGRIRSQAAKSVADGDLIDANTLRRGARELYDEARNIDARFSPQIGTNIARRAQEITKPRTSVQARASQRANLEGARRVDDAVDILNDLDDVALTVDDFDFIDKQLSSILQSSDLQTNFGQLNANGQLIKKLQDDFRDLALNAGEGSGAGAEILKRARNAWGRTIRLQNLEDDVAKAMVASNPQTALQSKMRSLYGRIVDGKVKGYTPAEVEIIKEVADTGIATELFNKIGTRIPASIAAGTGDFATAAALATGAQGGRNVATNRQLKKLDDLSQLIARGRPRQRSFVGADVQRGSNLTASSLESLGSVLQGAARLRAPQAAVGSTLGNLTQPQQ